MILKNDIRAFAFDLDGTLVNSLDDLANAANVMRQHLGLSHIAMEKIKSHIGDGMDTLVHRAITDERNILADPKIWQEGYKIFMEYYAQNLTRFTRAYPNVSVSLDYLKEKQFPLILITNKREDFARQILKDLKLEHYFDLILGGDSLAEKKPHALPLLHACDFCKIQPTQLAMIGDSQNDIYAARNARSIAIGVSYGYENVKDYAPDKIIDSLLELCIYG